MALGSWLLALSSWLVAAGVGLRAMGGAAVWGCQRTSVLSTYTTETASEKAGFNEDFFGGGWNAGSHVADLGCVYDKGAKR